MDETILKGWKILATSRFNLRYPKIDLGVTLPHSKHGRGDIKMETFIRSKNKEKLMFVRDSFKYSVNEDVFEIIETFKKHFIKRCELTIDKGIFNSQTSINEPHKLNIKK